jgi:hypothetical protein
MFLEANVEQKLAASDQFMNVICRAFLLGDLGEFINVWNNLAYSCRTYAYCVSVLSGLTLGYFQTLACSHSESETQVKGWIDGETQFSASFKKLATIECFMSSLALGVHCKLHAFHIECFMLTSLNAMSVYWRFDYFGKWSSQSSAQSTNLSTSTVSTSLYRLMCLYILVWLTGSLQEEIFVNYETHDHMSHIWWYVTYETTHDMCTQRNWTGRCCGEPSVTQPTSSMGIRAAEHHTRERCDKC